MLVPKTNHLTLAALAIISYSMIIPLAFRYGNANGTRNMSGQTVNTAGIKQIPWLAKVIHRGPREPANIHI